MNQHDLEKCEAMVAQLTEQLMKMRTSVSVSRNDLAQRSSLSNSAIQRIENGSRQPTLLSLFKISQSLGIDLWKVVKKAETEVKRKKNDGE